MVGHMAGCHGFTRDVRATQYVSPTQRTSAANTSTTRQLPYHATTTYHHGDAVLRCAPGWIVVDVVAPPSRVVVTNTAHTPHNRCGACCQVAAHGPPGTPKRMAGPIDARDGRVHAIPEP